MMRRRELKTLLVTIIACLVMALASIVVSAGSDDVIIQASLSGPSLNNLTPTGVAEHRTSATGSRRFKVEVEDVNLTAGTVLDVLVNGTKVGSLSINSFRQGEATQARTGLNEQCEFMMVALPPGSYKLRLRLPDLEVEIPQLELKA